MNKKIIFLFVAIFFVTFYSLAFVLTVFADNLPTLTLNSPANGSIQAATNVSFQCSASDDIGLNDIALYYGKVIEATKQFREDGTLVNVTDDAQITADTPNAASGSAASVKVDGLSPHSHAVLKFPNIFGPNLAQIPYGSEILSATLTVQCFNAGNVMNAYLLKEDFVEAETTWNQRSTGVSWLNPGADGSWSRETTGVPWGCTAIGQKSFNMMPFIQRWSNNTPNYGLAIIESGADGVEFYSSENAAISNRPLLTVTYKTTENWGPKQTQILSGISGTARFQAALNDQSTYKWNCLASDTSAQQSFAPADFTFQVNTLWTSPQSTEPNFKVAFIGDQGLGTNAQAVLQLIKNEGADMVLHQGDFDYADNPIAWDNQINNVLGPNFPYFASIGNHDVTAWTGYQQKLQERLSRIPEASCTGNLGVKSACRYKGLFFVLTSPGVLDSGHDTYIKDQLAQDNSIWSVCSWHKNQRLMQVGDKLDETGWGVYEECKKGGGILATAHEHSYSRTHLMSNFQTQIIASADNAFILEKGKSFAFVSGLGGDSIRPQAMSGAWWASIYTSTQGADFGALFCEFNIDNEPAKAHCYFKDIRGRVADDFELRSAVETLSNEAPIAKAGPDQTKNDTDNNGVEPITLDGSLSYDIDGTITAYEWKEGITVLATTPIFNSNFSVGIHTVTLTVTDNSGSIDTDNVAVSINPYQPPTITKQFRQDGSFVNTTDDAQITADTPNTASGSAASVKVDGLSPHAHVVLKYPNIFGSDISQIPLGSEIVSATLTVNCFNAGNSMTAYLLKEDWAESSVTWNKRTGSTNWTNPGADGPISRESAGVSWACTAVGIKTFDMKSFIQSWSSGASNFGVVIIDNGQDGVEFYSSENSTLSNRPLLTIIYR